MVDAGVPRPLESVPSADIPVPPEEVWAALTDPVLVEQWFGALRGPLRPGRDNVLDFGDGDFFALRPLRVEEPVALSWTWRFLGIEDPALIEWTLAPTPGGTRVRVRHLEEDGIQTTRRELLEGWQDFLSRLNRYLRTGRSSRYALRDSIDGSVTLPSADFRPLREPDLYRWLPVATDGFGPRWFFIVDTDGPRRFPLTDWVLLPDVRLSCRIRIPGADRPTRCSVEVRDGFGGPRLEFVHDGWTGLGLPDLGGMVLRRRFAATWIASLRTASELAAGTAGSGGAPDGAA
ncbi:SRPBCC domain-containing protein [Streptomyces sp. HPF1205]|uniref:SRPBCC family protein n=1 Tax=Streptomyces sp. HPF1205 TaxID=2873262 RepID=UPI001CED1D8C|nr:SRPBCC domain-containing protein [Streptomyces sp. HPF1205]